MNSKYIIALTSGLGNQMLQYALFHYLVKIRHYSCILHLYKWYLNQHNGLELTTIFKNIKIEDNPFFFNCYFRLYVFIEYVVAVLEKRFHMPFFKRLLSLFPYKAVIFPTWASYSFLGEIENLKDIYKFPDLDAKNAHIAELMKQTNSVSVHVRRGDFQHVLQWRIILGDICDKAYYTEAISKAESLLTNPTFFVFSDDIEWVKSNLDIKNAIYIDWNKGKDSYKDMQLMSYCKCNICANSTFSLMGAWLNVNSNPIRIVPTKWSNQYNDSTFEKYIPDEGWIPIDNSTPTVSIIVSSPVSERDIKNFLNQTYTDFEVLMGQENSFVGSDQRIKGNIFPSGWLIMRIDDCVGFRKRDYLESWVFDELKKDMLNKSL